MLDGLKRWIARAPAAPGSDSGWDEVAHWAEKRQYAYRGVHGDGFVVEGRTGTMPWRLEWGPSQRDYLAGHELRLRAELGLRSDLQMVVMNRHLQEAMEKAIFEQAVESVQTRIDNQSPPEARWLVMFPKLKGSDMGVLREHFVAVASMKPWLAMWLQGPLAQALVAQAADPAQPLVLMIGRGRLTLRTALDQADVEGLQAWLRVFETAMHEARRVASESPETAASSVAPGPWSSSVQPDEERRA